LDEKLEPVSRALLDGLNDWRAARGDHRDLGRPSGIRRNTERAAAHWTFNIMIGYGFAFGRPAAVWSRPESRTLLRLGGGRRVAGFVDVFNLLNANPEQNMSWTSGSFLRPLDIVPPRIARIGAKLEW
jgi:hypothetical protein